jgi:PAS domain S-box-containing protein
VFCGTIQSVPAAPGNRRKGQTSSSLEAVVKKHLCLGIINNLQEPIFVIDRSLRIAEINEAACVEYGQSRTEIIGRHCHEITHKSLEPCFSQGTECPAKTVFETGQQVRVVHQHQLPEGKTIWEEIIASPLKSSRGANDYVIEELRDLSEILKNQDVIRHLTDEVKTLRGIIPICAGCKRIKNDKGYWEIVEKYLKEHSQADFSHGLCPECMKKFYPDWYERKNKDRT